MNQPMRSHGPMGRGGGESAKDFVGTWKKMFYYCRSHAALMILALVCAIASTVFTLVGPNVLSDMTNTISDSVSPNTAAIEQLGQQISDNARQNMGTIMQQITAPLTSAQTASQKFGALMASSSLTQDQQALVQAAMAGMASGNTASLYGLCTLPQNVLATLFDPVTINGISLTPDDQAALFAALAGFDATGQNQASLPTDLPTPVLQLLFSDITFNGHTISSADQVNTLLTIQGLSDAGNDTSRALDALDQLPQSVQNAIQSKMDMGKITRLGLTLICFYVISYVLSLVQNLSMATITQRVSKSLRREISRKINRLPMWYYNRTSTGDVLSRVTNDVDTIGQSLNQSLGNLVHAVVLFVGSLIMMCTTNLIMTGAAVAATAIGFVLMFAIMSRSQKYFIAQQEGLGAINGYIEEMYTGQPIIKVYNGEEQCKKVFDTLNQKQRSAGFKAQCLSGFMQPIMAFIGNFGYVAVCVTGGVLALQGNISFGVIVAFMLYVRYFTNPLSQIAQCMQSLQSAAAAGERVFEFLEAEEMEDESPKTATLGRAKGEVSFSHVRFGYPDSDRIVINDFSATAHPGQKIAIVGPTGAGKTTLVNLLMRFFEIQGGQICIDNIPTNTLRREEVHAQFCMVLQDTWLFEGTVRENLVYCTKGVTDQQIAAACKAVGLDHFIRTLPHGYDTVLGDGVSLSQGQRQQLTIARAMIANRPMLILDEATSSVDTRTELQIQSAMDALMQNRTSFVIAHRLSTIKNADLILVLKDGDVIESGTHTQLLQKGGFYAELYNSQFDVAQ